MDKNELIKELNAIIFQVETGRFNAGQASIEVNRLVNLFTGDTPPIDWDIIAWGEAIVYDGNKGGIFLAKSSGGKLNILLDNAEHSITVKDEDVVLS